MRCKNCGSDVLNDTTFCPNCGSYMDSSEPNQALKQDSPLQPQGAPPQNNYFATQNNQTQQQSPSDYYGTQTDGSGLQSNQPQAPAYPPQNGFFGVQNGQPQNQGYPPQNGYFEAPDGQPQPQDGQPQNNYYGQQNGYYGPPPQYMPPPQQGIYTGPQTSSKSPTLALVFGILSILCGGGLLWLILSIVFGIKGIREQKERGLSIATPLTGLILGIIGAIFWGIITFTILPEYLSEMYTFLML